MKKSEMSEHKETSLGEEEKELRLHEVRDFFENLSADFSGYEFDRVIADLKSYTGIDS